MVSNYEGIGGHEDVGPHEKIDDTTLELCRRVCANLYDSIDGSAISPASPEELATIVESSNGVLELPLDDTRVSRYSGSNRCHTAYAIVEGVGTRWASPSTDSYGEERGHLRNWMSVMSPDMRLNVLSLVARGREITVRRNGGDYRLTVTRGDGYETAVIEIGREGWSSNMSIEGKLPSEGCGLQSPNETYWTHVSTDFSRLQTYWTFITEVVLKSHKGDEIRRLK